MKSLLLLGGTDNTDYETLRESAHSGSGVEQWSTLKEAAAGDEVWFYFPKPISAVVASGTAMADPRPGDEWPYVMPVGELNWLQTAVSRRELRAEFPDWRWTQTARGRAYLREDVASFLRERRGGSVPSGPRASQQRQPASRSPGREVIPAGAYRLNWNPDTNPGDVSLHVARDVMTLS